MVSLHAYFFRAYSVLTFVGTYYLLQKCMTEHKNYYDRVVSLTSHKLNLMLLLNFVIALLTNCSQIFVYVFFSQIRTMEKRVSPQTM